jgi:hypothetical protein
MGHFEAMTEEDKRAIQEKLDSLKPGEVAVLAGSHEDGRPAVCMFHRNTQGMIQSIILDPQGIRNTHAVLAEVIATAENDVSRN